MAKIFSSEIKSTKCEKIALVALILLAIVFPILVIYIVPLVVIDLVGPAMVENYFASARK